MSHSDFRDPRLTERRNPSTADIDVAPVLGIVDLLNAEDRRVPDAVAAARESLAGTIDRVVRAFVQGGRLVYVGAGTSGRLGVLDAAECPPTFGTPPEMVVGIIAGGAAALQRSQEGAEDDRDAGAAAIRDAGVDASDVVLGIAASGTTPYVGAALEEAARLGATTALLTCTDPPEDLAALVDEKIVLRVGPEALTGSTRLKAGTATKLALNTITTGAMVRLGKAYGNLMVDLMAMSEKLHDRGERIVMEIGGVDRAKAKEAIAAASGRVKRAIVMVKREVGPEEAQRLLDEVNGVVRSVIGDPPPVTQ
jgi:N-acetylmuramic acid 6-phosphate etherase